MPCGAGLKAQRAAKIRSPLAPAMLPSPLPRPKTVRPKVSRPKVSRPKATVLAALAFAIAAGGHGFGGAARSQDLVGCSLVDGQLSCVPGVAADPQAQIRALRQQIATTLAAESAVQQQIEGLQQLVLLGEQAEGALLVASLPGNLPHDLLVDLPASAFHWYRLPAGSSHWVLIEGASGPMYRLQAADVGNQVMVVVARPTAQGSERQASPAVGPVAPAPAQ